MHKVLGRPDLMLGEARARNVGLRGIVQHVFTDADADAAGVARAGEGAWPGRRCLVGRCRLTTG